MILMDSRGHHEIREALEELLKDLEIEVVLETLKSADLVFLDHNGKQIGVELKTTDDLLASIRTGRLFEQVTRMSLEIDIPILLPFGRLTPTEKGWCQTWTGIKDPTKGWPTYYQVMNALLSLQAHGIMVMPIQAHKGRAASMLYSMYRWFQKPTHKSMLRRSLPFTFGDQDSVQAIHMLTSIPRIDVGLAKRLLRHLGTPLAIFQATEEELRTIKGIGKVLAHNIHKAVRAEYRDA